MAIDQMAMKLARFAGKGILYPINGTTGAISGGGIDLGHMTVATIGAPSKEDLEEKSRRPENYDETIRTEAGTIEQIVTLETKTNNANNVMIALAGSQAANAQAAGNDATPQNVTAYLGKMSKLSGRNLDPATPPVVQDDGDTTTYVEDTDYEIDYKAGIITPISGGAITEADVLHVVSTWLEYNGTQTKANVNMDDFWRLEIINKNEVDDSREIAWFPKCTVAMTGDMARIGEPGEYQTFTLEAKLSKLGADYWGIDQYDD